MRRLSPTARHRLDHWLPPLLVGGLALLLYIATAAPGLTWAHDGADGGDLITAAVTGGVPHPSGYPTYCLLGRLFALLPLGSIARRMNLFSATLAAASAVLIYASCALLLSQRPTRARRRDALLAAGAALTYASGPTLWSQATIAEVYALAACCFALSLYLALRVASATPTKDHATGIHWAALGLTVGLGLGAHLTLALALPGLALLLWLQRTRRRLLALAAGGALGLGVYLYLPLAAAAHPVLNWGAADTWSGFWWLVSGTYYQRYAFALPLQYLPARLGAWTRLWGQQFAWGGLLVALVGLWSWWERGRRRWLAATLLTFALYSLYAITYDTTDSYVYLIPAYAVTVLWLAEGLRALADGYLGQGGRATRGWTRVALVLALALPAVGVALNYRDQNLRHDREATNWVDAVLDVLPPGALLITGEDGHTFALDYACRVEGRCGDRVVVDGELLAQPWYRDQLAQRYTGQELATGEDDFVTWVALRLSERRVFLSSVRPELAAVYQLTPHGGLWELGAQK